MSRLFEALSNEQAKRRGPAVVPSVVTTAGAAQETKREDRSPNIVPRSNGSVIEALPTAAAASSVTLKPTQKVNGSRSKPSRETRGSFGAFNGIG